MNDHVGADGDTIKLLRECDAGIKMGISSIDDVVDDVQNQEFRELLNESRAQHQKLANEIVGLLVEHGDKGKDPNPMAKSMSHIKTSVQMMADRSDKTIARLMTDGCDMGVKSLAKYLNQYQSADEKSKDITKRLVEIEDRLSTEMRPYL